MTPLVVGSGYLGRAVASRCPDALHTSREPQARPQDRRWLRFDLDAPSTWGVLDDVAAEVVIVAAPVGPRHDLELLWRTLVAVSPRVIVVGTTSAFVAGDEVTDSSPVDPTNPRALAEEELRSRGAAVLHAAGIYGPGRNPLDWVRRGLVTNAGKLVNLVHVDDLARACLFVGDRFEAGLRAVCSDGEPRPWGEIVSFAVDRGWIADPRLRDEEDPRSKRVRPAALALRGFRLAHPDLLAELAVLEAGG